MIRHVLTWAPLERDIIEGRYAFDLRFTGADLLWKSSRHLCPYCREPMQCVENATAVNMTRVERLTRTTRRRQWYRGALVPLTHEFLACRSCKEVFTVPRGGEAAARTTRGPKL